MKSIALAVLTLLAATGVAAQSPAAPPLPVASEQPDSTWTTGGKLRLQWDQRHANSVGPLALANGLQPGTVSATPSGATPSGATLETELRASGKNWNATVTLQQQTHAGQSDHSRAWFNELAASFDGGAWQYTVGKKIVAWDVGYAFKPNDVVQQEERRTLVSSTAEGRPVLMAEHYNADTAWSLVLVNPSAAKTTRGAKEPAVAARVFQRQGSVDWHGFARTGAHTGASVGAAVAWVATDALELHASARYANRYDSLAWQPATPAALQTTRPWQPVSARHTSQWLLGGTWTHETQLSVMLELWRDGSALAASDWRAWQQRNALLAGLPTLGAPTAAAAGNLAWQADAFSAASSLQRNNAYIRLAWEYEGWQPTLDVFYHPADGGRIVTAALLWKGDRVQVQAGLRSSHGPTDAVLKQLPNQRQGYVATSWAF